MLFGMRRAIFRRWLGPKERKAATLGVRPKLLLAKFGFEMRSDYDHLLQEPLPVEFQPLIEQLPGANRDVIDLSSHRRASADRSEGERHEKTCLEQGTDQGVQA